MYLSERKTVVRNITDIVEFFRLNYFLLITYFLPQ